MTILKSDPRVVYFSTLMYRLLLITYPKDFQRGYSACMAQVFRDSCLRAFHTRGLPGLFSLWSMVLVDYLESVFKEYTRKGVLVNASRFIRLSGWALILGTATFLTGLLVEVQISGHGPAFDPYNYYSRPIDQFLAVLPNVLAPSSMLLLTIGVMGLYLRYGPGAGLLGKTGLVAGIAGGVFALVTCIAGGSFGLTIFLVSNQVGGWWLWDLATLGMFLLFGSIFTFGIDAVKRRLLSRWNFIPILAGILIPVRILLGYIQIATTKTEPNPWLREWREWGMTLQVINLPILIITSLGLIALGYLMISDAQQEEQFVIG